jgi:putative transposase
MKRSHKIRLYPNKAQDTLLKKTCGCNRYAYNWLLNQANENYKQGVKYNKFELKRAFNAYKLSLEWMQEVNAHAVINDAIDKVDKGFKNFWAKRARHPRFHSKRKGLGSFSLPGSEIKYDKKNKKVYICRIGWLRMAEAVRFEYTKLYRITVTNRAGKWFVSFNLEVNDNRVCENQTDKIGVDRGVSKLAACSKGNGLDNPRISNRYLCRLRQLNKELSRRTKGGKNWWKTVLKLQKLHERIAYIRYDVTHKFTTEISKHYGIVCLEDLNVQGMVKNHNLARHIYDASFSEMKRQFEYKAMEVRYVDRWFPSSKRCSSCGHIHERLTLSDRTFVCPHCGFILDRDLNAAINIETFAVSSTGSKKSAVKTALAKPSGEVKQSRGQKLNMKSNC